MHVAVTAIGRDRPGIVAAVARVLYDHEGNIEDSRMAMLGGHFAMMLIVALPEGSDAPALERALAEEGRALGLFVQARPVEEVARAGAGGDTYVLSVYGADHPGIVWRVSDALAARGVNITDLATHVVEGDPPVYVMALDVTLPPALDPADLEAALGALGAEVGVDVSMRASDADTL